MGAFKQKKLPGEVFQVIETTIMTGGQPLVVTGAGQTVAVGMIVCPSCKAQLTAGSKFCNRCGTKLNTKCPELRRRYYTGKRILLRMRTKTLRKDL